MKAFLRVGLLAWIILVQHYSFAQEASLESNALVQLRNRLSANDEQAFEEASKLPVNEAAPILLVYVNDASTNAQRAERAREILRTLPGFSDYMKQRLLTKRSHPGGEYEMSEFRLLGAIGGDAAAAAAAPFLFVDDPTLLIADAAGPISSMALGALVNMHLPDAPNDKSYPGYTSPDFEEWKAWAEKKGYRDVKIPPLMTLQQKGVPPDAITRSESILAGAKPSPNAGTPAPVCPKCVHRPMCHRRHSEARWST